MKPADVAVWERVIELYPLMFAEVEYDFHVGRGAQFLPDDESSPDGRENRLYKYKIDVVGFDFDRIEVIEVKPHATMAALGQALATAEMFKEQENPELPVIPCVAAADITPDMEKVYAATGVKTILAPAAV